MKTESITLGAFRYECTQLLAEDGIPVFCTLVNLCASAQNPDSMIEVILGALRSKELRPAMNEFYTTFRKNTLVHTNGKSVPLEQVFNTHFAGNYDHLIKWLIFNFELNLGKDFLAAVKNAVSKKTEHDSSSPSAPAPTGSPGT
jgi:hypothetical protein